MPNRYRNWPRDISTLDITKSPREESALFVVEMLERLEIQSSEEFRKQFSHQEIMGSRFE